MERMERRERLEEEKDGIVSIGRDKGGEAVKTAGDRVWIDRRERHRGRNRAEKRQRRSKEAGHIGRNIEVEEIEEENRGADRGQDIEGKGQKGETEGRNRKSRRDRWESGK